MADVRLRNIKKSFGRVEVLHGVSLDIPSGVFISLLGASGCGKTTLLRIVAGLETVTSGSVEIDGRDVTGLPPEQRDIAMMFQSYALLPHLSVAENVRFPLRMRGIGSVADQRERVQEALDTVQLGHLADRRPRQLSGGQQQRVALARAIVSRPKVLLLDEPLSNLDARLREDMHVELIELHKRLGLTTIFVTHDQEEALSLSDRIVLINNGDVEQEDTPANIYSRPATAFASAFLGAANLIDAEVLEGGTLARLPDGQKITLPKGTHPPGPVTLSIRQEDIVLTDGEGDGPMAEIGTRIFLGARNRYVLRLGETRLRALAPSDQTWGQGAQVRLSIDPERLRVLPRASKD